MNVEIPWKKIELLMWENPPLWSTQEFTKTRSKFLWELAHMLDQVSWPGDFQQFIEFKEKIISQIVKFFERNWLLMGKTDVFVSSLTQWNRDSFTGSEEDKKYLDQLLLEKAILMRSTLYMFIYTGKLDEILTTQDTQTLLKMIESSIFSVFDSIYLQFKEVLPNQDDIKKIPKPLETEVPFWFLTSDGIKAYRDIVDVSRFTSLTWELSSITDKNFLECATWIQRLILQGNTNYRDWTDNESKWELQSWINPSSTIALIYPMEDYIASWRAIDPELVVMLRQKNDEGIAHAIELANMYFGQGYGIETTQFYLWEAIVWWGLENFSRFLWKNFPNDNNLKARFGTFIVHMRSGTKHVYDNALPYLKKLIQPDFSPDAQSVMRLIDSHIEFHEYGHNLFIANYSNNMEESKPSLFHDLKLYHENILHPFDNQKIRDVIHMLLVDATRDIIRHKNPQFFKYVIYTKMVLRSLFSTGCIYWEGETLKVDIDTQKFSAHLENMKTSLERIKKIYLPSQTNDTHDDSDEKFIVEIEADVWEDFQKIYERMMMGE